MTMLSDSLWGILGISWGILIIVLCVFYLVFQKRIRKIQIESESKIQTERINIQKEVQTKFDLILGSMEDGVIITDDEQKIVHANKSLSKWFQIPENIVGKKLSEVFEMPEFQPMLGGLEDSINGVSNDIELKFPRYCFLHIERSIIKDNRGKKIGEVFVFHDQTRLFLLEKTRQEFIANVSHELRTPLTLIKGCVETLIDGAKGDPETANKFLQTIKKHADRITYLIEDLLTISKLESGQIQMNFQRLDLFEIVKEVILDLKDRAESKGVKISNKIECGFDVIADPERLKQVFYNLLDNAIKYGRINGNVWIEATKDENKTVKISIRDDGPGIPPEARERIFERFYRVDKARSREQGGTGLGLSIVKHIIQTHGGKVWVDSQFGRGATFYFTLPDHDKKTQNVNI